MGGGRLGVTSESWCVWCVAIAVRLVDIEAWCSDSFLSMALGAGMASYCIPEWMYEL